MIVRTSDGGEFSVEELVAESGRVFAITVLRAPHNWKTGKTFVGTGFAVKVGFPFTLEGCECELEDGRHSVKSDAPVICLWVSSRGSADSDRRESNGSPRAAEATPRDS